LARGIGRRRVVGRTGFVAFSFVSDSAFVTGIVLVVVSVVSISGVVIVIAAVSPGQSP
jgi:hypothetical protein